MKTRFIAVGMSAIFAACTAQAGELTIASFGGKVQEDLAKTLWTPAAENLGVTLRQESHDGLAATRLQVQSGNPGWDIVHLGSDMCAAGAKEGLFEPLDYSVIDTDGIAEVLRGENWISQNAYSVVMAWRTDTFGDNPPKNWADFWNAEAFPGRRALSVYPEQMMEIALMADGVDKDELYPLDVERSIASLNKVQADIDVWWTSGAQSAQLIADGEVDMLAIWGSRVNGVIANGAPVDFTYEQGVLGMGCLAILKGAANVEEAQKLIAEATSPKLQARIPEMMPYYGPANTKAFELTKASQDVIDASNTSPANAALQMVLDVRWWADHNAEVQEDYKGVRLQ